MIIDFENCKTAIDAGANVSAAVSPLNPGANGTTQLFHYNLQGVDVADEYSSQSMNAYLKTLSGLAKK